MTAEAFEQAQAQIEADGSDGYLHIAASEHFLAGIVGLVAGRLVEQYYRPAVVMELGQQQSRGSARSIGEFDITAALDRCAAEGLLVRHGGHAAAAGLTVENRKLPALTARLREIAAEELAEKDLRPPLLIDQEIALGDVDYAVLGLLQEMEPTGYANPQPRLLSRRLLVRDARKVGADGAHLKLTVSDPGPARAAARAGTRSPFARAIGTATCPGSWTWSTRWKRTSGTATAACSWSSRTCGRPQRI